MTERAVGVTDVAAGAGVVDYRTRERSVGGTNVVEQYLLCENERVASFKGAATTFRIPTAGAGSAQRLATLWNPAASGLIVAIRRLSVQIDYASTSAAVRVIRLNMGTVAPSGGALHAGVPFDSTMSTSVAEFRGGASADDVVSAITAALGSGEPWGEFHMHQVATGHQVRILDDPMVPLLARKDPLYLRPGESAIVYNVNAAPSTVALYAVNCCWEEFTLP